MQQLCYNVIEEIIVALNEEIMLQLASATLFLETITKTVACYRCIKKIVGKYSQ